VRFAEPRPEGALTTAQIKSVDGSVLVA